MSHRDLFVPPAEGRSFVLRRGESVRVIDLEGEQVCDFICFNLHQPAERLSTGETMNFNPTTLSLPPGSRLYSNLHNPMVEVIADTSPGIHDLLYAPCSSPFYAFHAGDPKHRNCRDNLAQAVQPYGLRYIDIPDPVNLFQYTRPQADGSIEIRPAASKPGDYVEVRALMDCLVAVSSCPCDLAVDGGASIIGAGPTPLRVEFV